jgi:hypothetical protein
MIHTNLLRSPDYITGCFLFHTSLPTDVTITLSQVWGGFGASISYGKISGLNGSETRFEEIA